MAVSVHDSAQSAHPSLEDDRFVHSFTHPPSPVNETIS